MPPGDPVGACPSDERANPRSRKACCAGRRRGTPRAQHLRHEMPGSMCWRCALDCPRLVRRDQRRGASGQHVTLLITAGIWFRRLPKFHSSGFGQRHSSEPHAHRLLCAAETARSSRPVGRSPVAQLFLAALRLAGHEPLLASRFRSYDGSRRSRSVRPGLPRSVSGWPSAFCAAGAETPEFSPELWFSYHVYHKAPDWLGPAIATALDIPYVVAEASVTPMQALGPRAFGHRAAECAIRRADAVIGLNPADRECVLPLLRDPWRWVAFKPFLDAASYGRKGRPEAGPPRLITVAMMRPVTSSPPTAFSVTPCRGCSICHGRWKWSATVRPVAMSRMRSPRSKSV